MLKKASGLLASFPRDFRLLVAATFIDRLGGFLIFPFLSLYVASKFQVGMTQVGIIFGLWSISGLIGNMIGGNLADQYGRKIVLIFGLISSALTGLLMGFIDDIRFFYFLASFAGIFSDIGHPAQQAMVADLLEENQRAEGYSLLRVVINVAAAIGPMIGGFLAGISYLMLFIIDALASILTALFVLKFIPETKPLEGELNAPGRLRKEKRQYGFVLTDTLFMAFICACIVLVSVYVQMYSTLSVFLNQVHQISETQFGFLMSINALMVVFLQYWLTKTIKGFPSMILMAMAAALYGVGFTLFGLTHTFGFFLFGMGIITFGEMVHMPVAQALVSQFAPIDKRGRYMAVYGWTWAIPNSAAPLLAGLVMDNLNPNWVWYASGIFSIIAIIMFLILQTRVHFEHEKA